MSKRQKFIVKMAVTAMLVALTAVLNRFGAITTEQLKIGFSFVPIMVCGMMFGPLWGGICAAMGDFLAAIFMPLGNYHPGFTAAAVISGIVYGFLGMAANRIDNKFLFTGLSAAAVFTENLVCDLLINSIWLSQLYDIPYSVQLIARIPQAVILFLPETVFAVVVKFFILPPIKKVMK